MLSRVVLVLSRVVSCCTRVVSCCIRVVSCCLVLLLVSFSRLDRVIIKMQVTQMKIFLRWFFNLIVLKISESGGKNFICIAFW